MRVILCGLAVLIALASPSFAHSSVDAIQYRDYDRDRDRDRDRDHRESDRRIGPERRHELNRLDREISEARANHEWRRVHRLEERRESLLRR